MANWYDPWLTESEKHKQISSKAAIARNRKQKLVSGGKTGLVAGVENAVKNPINKKLEEVRKERGRKPSSIDRIYSIMNQQKKKKNEDIHPMWTNKR